MPKPNNASFTKEQEFRVQQLHFFRIARQMLILATEGLYTEMERRQNVLFRLDYLEHSLVLQAKSSFELLFSEIYLWYEI